MDKNTETETKYAKESELKRKTSTSTTVKKRTRIKAADVEWCINSATNLSVKAFALAFKYSDRQYCHARYKLILESHIQDEHRSRLQDEFEAWRKTMDCPEFWDNQRRAKALAKANDNCPKAANTLFIANTQGIRSSVVNYHVRGPAPTTSFTPVAPVLATTGTLDSLSHFSSVADTTASTPNEHNLDTSAPTSTADIYDNGIIGPVTAKFRQYQSLADSIPKPCLVEPNIQEILALADVLFLAPEQHSDLKVAVFGQELLDKVMSHQTKMLLDKVPAPCSEFTSTDFMAIVDIVSAIDAKSMSPKQAKLQLLIMASEVNDLRANVITGIADMIMNIPQSPIADQGSYGEVDIQTRFYNPLLASIIADVTKKVLLRWQNKTEKTVPQIRPDAIVSILVQLKFGMPVGYGEVKLGDDSTTNHSLCVDTMKLAVLSRNGIQKCGYPIISFQVNGFHLIFFLMQELGPHLYTMLEIGRVDIPSSLSSLRSFITLKNLSTLLRVTSIFWSCCVQGTHLINSALPSEPLDISVLLSMTDKLCSKTRECAINYT